MGPDITKQARSVLGNMIARYLDGRDDWDVVTEAEAAIVEAAAVDAEEITAMTHRQIERRARKAAGLEPSRAKRRRKRPSARSDSYGSNMFAPARFRGLSGGRGRP